MGKAATIALLNLSLVLALGALSATPIGKSAFATGVAAAFIGATLGGLLVALFARAPAEIAGPASSVAVIYAALAADLVARAGANASLAQIWAALSLAVVLAGVIVFAAGLARLAGAIRFMPLPVNAGFVTGIGLLVVWSQVGPLLGIEGPLSSLGWRDLAERWKPASLLVGAVTGLTVWAYPKVRGRGPPALAALALGTACYYAVASLYGRASLGPTLGTFAPLASAEATLRSTWSVVDIQWLRATAWIVAPYAGFMALQIIMNAAVSAAAVAAIRGARSDVNRTLKVEGWVNVVCGGLGALPISTIASIAVPAARMGSSQRIAVASSALLFVAVIAAGELLGGIPVAVLAAILIMGGGAMIDRWALGLLGVLRRASERRASVAWNLAIVAAVAGTFFFGSVPLALLVGALLAMVLLALSLSEATTVESMDESPVSTRVWPAENARWLAGQRSRIAVFRPRGSLFFGTADPLATKLEATAAGVEYVVLDVSRMTTMDATGCQIIAAAARKLAARKKTMLLAGADPEGPRAEELVALGLTQPGRDSHWHVDLDHALEWVERELLRVHQSGETVDAAMLGESPLAQGLTAAQVEELRACMRPIDAVQGTLFTSGDPGDSMYFLESGLVEIRTTDSARSTRLATFGPGSIFGEIAMLTATARTADAVCMQASKLHELTRDSLASLAARSPQLHSRLIENLNRHLANRLVIATRTVRAGR